MKAQERKAYVTEWYTFAADNAQYDITRHYYRDITLAPGRFKSTETRQ